MKLQKKSFPYFSVPPDEVRRTVIEEKLVTTYPAIRRERLGESLCGREISLFRVGEGPLSHLYIGAHHGMEWLTSLLLYRFLDDLGKSIVRRGMPGDGILSNGSLAVIPMLNPDGVEISLHGEAGGGAPLRELLSVTGELPLDLWQANARGVDLNHNYPTGFAEYKPIEARLGITGGGPTRYSGPRPLSEPETCALARLLKREPPRLLLTLHTQGEEIYYRKTAPPRPGADRIAAALAAMTGYRLADPEGAAAYGGLADWLGEEGILAYTLECGLGKNPLPITGGGWIYLRLRRALFLSLGLFGEPQRGLLSLPTADQHQKGVSSMSHVSGENIREKEVINSCDGRRLGFVSDIEFDICDGRITAIVLPGKGGFLGCGGENIVIPWEKIQKIGEDIILVDAEGCCPPPKPPRKR